MAATLGLALALAPGCSLTRRMDCTQTAFGAGMTVGGVPAIVAALPITLPLSAAFGDSSSALSILAWPAFLPGGVLGVAFAAPVALFELPVELLRAALEHAAPAREQAPAPAEPAPAPASAELLALEVR